MKADPKAGIENDSFIRGKKKRVLSLLCIFFFVAAHLEGFPTKFLLEVKSARICGLAASGHISFPQDTRDKALKIMARDSKIRVQVID